MIDRWDKFEEILFELINHYEKLHVPLYNNIKTKKDIAIKLINDIKVTIAIKYLNADTNTLSFNDIDKFYENLK
jgi:hypothetical protein